MDREYESEKENIEELAKISAKVTVAGLLMEQGRKLAEEAENDLKFYKITNNMG
jgi:hypothetical protein